MTARSALMVMFSNSSLHANSYMESSEIPSYLLITCFSFFLSFFFFGRYFHNRKQFGVWVLKLPGLRFSNYEWLPGAQGVNLAHCAPLNAVTPGWQQCSAEQNWAQGLYFCVAIQDFLPVIRLLRVYSNNLAQNKFEDQPLLNIYESHIAASYSLARANNLKKK